MKAFLSLLGPVLIFSTLFMLNPIPVEAQNLEVELKIERYTSVTGEINIRSYIKDVEHYTGFRLAAVEIAASALNDTATMTVYVNDMQQGQSLHLGQTTSNHLVSFDTDFFIGQGAEKIKLKTINPAYIKTLNLVLTR